MTENTTATQCKSSTQGSLRKSLKLAYLLPVLSFLVVGGFLLWGLNPNRDPSEVPSVLIGKLAPNFELPPVLGRTRGLTTADLKGEVSLVNVAASWCISCRIEHPLFMQLKAEGAIPIYGINYKDTPEDAANWLADMGDPYTLIGADLDGRVSIEWGVYGVPETFVINREGRIVYKKIGPITPRFLKETLMPLIEKVRQQ